MTWQGALYDRLKNDAALAAEIGARIEPVRLLESPTLPALVYQKLDGESFGTHSGGGYLKDSLIRILVYAKTSEKAKQVASLVTVAMEKAPKKWTADGTRMEGAYLEGDPDLGWDKEVRAYGVALDFAVIHD